MLRLNAPDPAHGLIIYDNRGQSETDSMRRCHPRLSIHAGMCAGIIHRAETLDPRRKADHSLKQHSFIYPSDRLLI